jgi:tetratricopeptide (TPR) repeat protein
MLKLFYALGTAALMAALLPQPALAASKGQTDLDKAIEVKLFATTIRDLGEVIRLTESALNKGLDANDTRFAKLLLSASLIQRAEETTKHIFTNVSTPEDFRQRRQSALADLERAIKLDPKQPQAYLLIAQLNMLPEGAGDKEARAALDKAIALGGDDFVTAPIRSKALVMRANLQRDPAARIADFDQAVKLAPGDAATVRNRGAALRDLGQFEPALRDFNKATKLEPDDGPTYEAKAGVLVRLGRLDEALTALDRAHRLTPEAISPLLQRAEVHRYQQKFDAALADLAKALDLEPGNITVLLMRAGVYQLKGDRKKALAEVDQALRLKPDHPEVIRARAGLLAQEGHIDEAIQELEKGLKVDPQNPQTVLQLAQLCDSRQQAARAAELYTKLLALRPDLWQIFRCRGDDYVNLGKHAEAVADYEKALKFAPQDQYLLNITARLLATSPDTKIRNGRQAVELATEACKLTQYKVAPIISTLAAAYAEMGDFPSAVKWSTKALELNDQQQADALKRELENYKANKPLRELLVDGKRAAK